MSEIDWPPLATHYWAENNTFYIERSDGFYYLDGRYCGRFGSVAWISALIHRPSPAWNGEGLPPVGTLCEHFGTSDSTEWLEVEVIAHGEVDGRKVAFFRYGIGSRQFTVSYSTANNFRPIRTPEQIAADEREAAVAEMQRVIAESDAFVVSSCEALYDAGLRFIKP